LVAIVHWVWFWCSDVATFALLDGGSLFSGFESDLWCSAVSTVSVALVMFLGCIGMLVLA
jgi:hypothetical protein